MKLYNPFKNWYNPFKPHIVEYRPGRFTIRKLSIEHLGWAYKESNGDFYISNYGYARNLDEAKERLAYKKPPKFKPRVIF